MDGPLEYTKRDVRACAIDFQYFLDGNGMMAPKELAVVDLLQECCQSFLLQPPPCLAKSTVNDWAYRWHHGLSYQSGHTPYRELGGLLRSTTKPFALVYAKGHEKASFLVDHLKSDMGVIDINILKPPRLSDMAPGGRRCLVEQHMYGRFACAVNNAWRIKNWINGNAQMLQDKELRKSTLSHLHSTKECHERMAESGFVYSGVKDLVVCVHCGIRTRAEKWTPDHGCWKRTTEHCIYLLFGE